MPRQIALSAVTALILLLAALPLRAAEPFLLNGGETIVFFGDSITQNGGYINYFEAYLLTRFPDKSFRVINHGINGQTISGTTEEDHDPPRQSAMPRFDRDVAAWKPDIVVACFGMNDGNYHPFGEVRFRKYQAGIRELIRRVKQQTDAKLILMTPPPYDPYRRRVLDPEAKTFGYKFAAIDYDETLKKYAEWLVTLRKEGQVVVDLHSAMNEHVSQRRKELVSFSISPDAVHPSVTGHWLIAQHLLLAMNAPPQVAEVTVDVEKKSATGHPVHDLKVIQSPDRLGTAVTFTWTTPLPMPLDVAWDRRSLELEQMAERLNRHRIAVTGLSPSEFGYSLRINDKHMAIFPAAAWKSGIDLVQFPREEMVDSKPEQQQTASLSKLPTNVAARKLLAAVQERRRLVYAAWRAEIADKPVDAKAALRVKQLSEQIESLRKPQTLKLQIQPFSGI